MMEIVLNGVSEAVEPGISITELVGQKLPGQGRFAIEVNLEIIPRGRHKDHILKPGDRVEIVRAVGGG